MVEKFEPKNQKLIWAVRKALRKRLPAANELVYDNYNFFVIGYSKTERPSDAVLSMIADRNGVGVAFPYVGAKLADPKKLLQGSGTKNRSMRLASAEVLTRPEVDALIAAAEKLCAAGAPGQKGQLVIRSVSEKQRKRK